MTAEPFATKCSVPADTLAYRAVGRVDYADAYSITLAMRGPEILDRYASVMFSNPPPWVSALIGLRDCLVSFLGLKTSAELRSAGDRGATAELSSNLRSSFGPFPVLARSENELLLRADDYHLDFRISVQWTEIDSASQLRVTTVVQFNNLLGRIYFLPIGPFHRIIVPGMMDRAARAICDTDAA